jgi:nucleoside phosphorylase
VLLDPPFRRFERMNILVTYAVDPEFDPWKKRRKFQDIRAGDFTLRRTEIGAASVDFLVTGMGPQRAARAMEAIASQEYAFCIASGFAGSLHRDLAVGDIVVPKAVRESGSANTIVCDSELVERTVSSGGTKIEAMVSCDGVATTVAGKARLAESGAAVDMESFAIIEAAQRRNIRAVVIRVISDRHDQALPVDLSTTIDERGQVSIGAVLRIVAGNPGQISALMKFGRESKAAADVLARFLEAHIPAIAGIARLPA